MLARQHSVGLILSALGLAGTLLVAGGGALASGDAGATPAAPLPQHLRDTGLFVDGPVNAVRPGNIPFSPQYPLWSDGATKRRWLWIPPGTAIDASNANAWDFPPGTRLWKEFAHGRPVETRFIERLADGSWRYATYVWNEDGTDAVLAPAEGIAALPVRGAPGGRYAVPGEADCRACHEGPPVPVLGASALQLSGDRDPLAPHADGAGAGGDGATRVDLRQLVARGVLRNLPPALLEHPPRIVAATPTERAALGYLHANCGHCHNRLGDNAASVPVDLTLAQDVTDAMAGSSHDSATRFVVGAAGRYRPAGAKQNARLVAAGDADASLVVLRMRSRNPNVQMPPLGTRIPDADGLALVERWITRDLPQREESKP